MAPAPAAPAAVTAPVSSVLPALEVRLGRLADDVTAIVQALQRMSSMQRQQGEQLATIVQLLTPQAADAGHELHTLLKHLTASNSMLIIEIKLLAEAVEGAAQALPGQLEAAVGTALARGEGGRG